MSDDHDSLHPTFKHFFCNNYVYFRRFHDSELGVSFNTGDLTLHITPGGVIIDADGYAIVPMEHYNELRVTAGLEPITPGAKAS
jgi:hypothetical protein